MPDPLTLEEYNEKSQKAIRIEGFGADTRTVLCCPFCGEPDWLVFRVVASLEDEAYASVQKPVTCKGCQRTGRLQIGATPYSTTMGILFLDGPKPPAWLPKFYRDESKQ